MNRMMHLEDGGVTWATERSARQGVDHDHDGSLLRKAGKVLLSLGLTATLYAGADATIDRAGEAIEDLANGLNDLAQEQHIRLVTDCEAASDAGADYIGAVGGQSTVCNPGEALIEARRRALPVSITETP